MTGIKSAYISRLSFDTLPRNAAFTLTVTLVQHALGNALACFGAMMINVNFLCPLSLLFCGCLYSVVLKCNFRKLFGVMLMGSSIYRPIYNYIYIHG
jgi:hypothetical protein